jgi:DinB superfamily
MPATDLTDRLPGVGILEQSPIIIEKILHTATDEQLHWKPSADRWSISEVLAHLADVEVAGFRERVENMLKSNSAHLAYYDQEAAYREGRYSQGKAREHLRNFCHERDRTLSFLRYIPSAAGARTADHSTIGKITINELMNEWAFHDLGHIRQIAELFRAHAFYPHIGAFQRFYTVHP